MRPCLLAFALLLSALNGHANSLFEQLCAFNPYWRQHADHLKGLPSRDLRNDVDYVRTHLEQVLGVLQEASTDRLTASQRASRAELMAVLAEYARQGRFPINYHRRGRTPVFIDEHNTFCAVGHLMRYTGQEAMARRIAAANNLAWVREIKDAGLGAWQQASGFSLDELKLIQGAYDYYMPDAFLLPNKYEVPQKPEQVVRYFEGKDKDKVWCYGEGSKGDLHGQWIQNYSSTLPWIVGYFEHGKRSGRWKEYYKGTDKLCRTEHWRDDKLNGIRTRYDREGKVIETILFRNGQAVVKTNIDEDRGLRWVRTPIDSAVVRTEIFTTEGGLIAAGKERIHNPEGLQWFQNIELTALNSFAISARDGAPRPEEGVMVSRFQLDGASQQLPGEHTLVTYRKEGEWTYYKDYLHRPVSEDVTLIREGVFTLGYMHFGTELYTNLASYDHWERTASYDSMHVVYKDDRVHDLVGFTATEQDHFEFAYHEDIQLIWGRWHQRRSGDLVMPGPVKRITRMNDRGELVGVRVEYDEQGHLVRADHFFAPYKKEDELVGAAAH